MYKPPASTLPARRIGGWLVFAHLPDAWSVAAGQGRPGIDDDLTMRF
jgi:hypothetical protein